VEYEISWGGDPEDACVTTRGEASLEGFNSWMEEGLSDPRYREGISFILDHRQLDWSGISLQDVQDRIELTKQDSDRYGRVRVAMVMRAAVDFGLARMYQAYIELQSDLQIEIGVFISIEDAREWIRIRKAADAGPAST
jgi:hypothetical protein